jgi:hypothetical protein
MLKEQQPTQFCDRQLLALLEGGADPLGHSFPGPQWPPNLGGLSWRWLCRLKGASSEKAGIFVSAFQSVAMPQTLPFLDLAVLPAGVLRRGRTRSVLKAMPVHEEMQRDAAIIWQSRRWFGAALA